MSVQRTNPLLATLVVAVTLLVCAFLPKALRDTTVLLQYRTARLQESTPRMNSSRQMQDLSFFTRIYVPTTVTCPLDHIVRVKELCVPMAKKLIELGYTLSFPRGFKELPERARSNHPAGCFLLNGRIWFNPKIDSTATAESGTAIRTLFCGSPSAVFIKSGHCPAGVLPEQSCVASAFFLGLVSTPPWESAPSNYKARSFSQTLTWPKGCVKHKEALRYNENDASIADCSKVDGGCICASPAPAGGAAPLAYIKRCTTCPTPVTEADCEASANGLGLVFSSYNSTMSDLSRPYGCFKHSSGSLYFNSAESIQECSSQDACLCSGIEPKTYSVMRETCKKIDRLDICECRRRAIEAGFEITSEDIHDDTDYPSGCYVTKKKLWFNEAASAANCTPDQYCVCANSTVSEIR